MGAMIAHKLTEKPIRVQKARINNNREKSENINSTANIERKKQEEAKMQYVVVKNT